MLFGLCSPCVSFWPAACRFWAGREEVEGEAIKVYRSVGGLTPGKQYSYCLVAWNGYGETPGQAVTFTPPWECPSLRVETEGLRVNALAAPLGAPSIGVSQRSHTLRGSISLGCGGKVSYHFTYGLVSASGSSTPTEEVTVPADEGSAQVRTDLTGLEPETTYRYRLVVTYGAEAASGKEAQFTTPSADGGPEVPITEDCGPIKITQGELLCGTLNPGSDAKTGYYFAYSTGATCTGGKRTQLEPEVEGERIRVRREPEGIELGTQYTYCLVASNQYGEAFGQPLFFTTPFASPVVYGESAGSITQTTATLQAEIDPNKRPTNYSFQYSDSPPATKGPRTLESLTDPTVVPGGSLAAGASKQTVSTGIEGLQPDTTYYYQAIATSSAGTSEGTFKSFITLPSLPLIPPLPPVPTVPSASSTAATQSEGQDTTVPALATGDGILSFSQTATGPQVSTKTPVRAKAPKACEKRPEGRAGRMKRAKKTRCERRRGNQRPSPRRSRDHGRRSCRA